MIKLIIVAIVLFIAWIIIRELRTYKRLIKEENLAIEEDLRKKELKIKSKRTELKISNDKLERKIKKKE